jgi:hypothetical protein
MFSTKFSVSLILSLILLGSMSQVNGQGLPSRFGGIGQGPTISGTPIPDPDHSGLSGTPTPRANPTTAIPFSQSGYIPARPTVGAFYYLWFKDDGFHWEATKGRPLVGNEAGFYSSADEGIMRQHILWAKEFGINFWLLSYWHIEKEAYQWPNIRRKIEICEEMDFQYVMLLEPDPDVYSLLRQYTTGRRSLESYLNEATNWFLNRLDIIEYNQGFLDSPAYLRESDGRKIIGFFHWDTPLHTAEVLRRASIVRPELNERFWIWYIGGHGAGNHQAEVAEVLFPRLGAWAPYVPMAEEGWERTLELYRTFTMRGDKRILTVAPSFDNTGLVSRPTVFPRDGGLRFIRYLEDIRNLPRLPNYLLITSWNEWQEDSILDPDLTEPDPFVYLSILRNWLSSFGE